MTTATINEKWKKQWESLYNEFLEKVQNDKEKHTRTKNNCIKMLDFTSENFDTILTKFNEFITMLPSLKATQNMVHTFMNDAHGHHTQQARLKMVINEHIHFQCDDLLSDDDYASIRCDVIVGKASAIFILNQYDPEYLMMYVSI